MNVRELQTEIGVEPDGQFGPKSRAALFAEFSNPDAPRFSPPMLQQAADRLGVPVQHIKASIAIESPRGSYDSVGRPTILFERHKFAAHTQPPNRFNLSNPDLSGKPYGPGGYGPYGGQWDKLAAACALDPSAAFMACSWGAFQVMGDNAISLGYDSAYAMALSLTVSEAAHLETYVRFIERNGLEQALQACRPNDPDSCRPFVKAYNGAKYEDFSYHRKFASALMG
jgi:hypothetical protein